MKKGALLWLVYIVLTSGCNDRGPVDRTPVYMKWMINGTVSEFFYGKERGYFIDNGIDIEIVPGGPGASGPKLVAAKPGTFAVTGAEELIRAVAQKMPVTAIMVKFQDNPVCFLGRDASHISHPADFKGKTIAVVYGENTEVQYRALLRSANLSDQDVTERSWSFDLSRFVSGEIDVIPAYCFDQPLALRRQHFTEFTVIKPTDYHIDPYGDILITGTKTIEENPDLVRRFLEAYLRSLAGAMRNPDIAVQSLTNAHKDLTTLAELETWREAMRYICRKGSRHIGEMTYAVWQRSIDLLTQYGRLNPDLVKEFSYQRPQLLFRPEFLDSIDVKDRDLQEIIRCSYVQQ